MTRVLTYLIVIFIAITTPFEISRVVELQSNIQTQRRDSILASRRDQNRRHDNTIGTLNGLAKKDERKHPAETPRIQASLAQTELLIQALAPKQNCESLANRYVRDGG